MRKTKPIISIIIPAYNEERYLGECLNSLKNQDFKGKYEIIVVDNNSTDNTRIIAERMKIKVLFEPKRGVGWARRKGFDMAQGEIIVTTDADTILPKNWLSRIVNEFEKDKGLVGFGGLYTLSSGSILARLVVRYFLYPVWLADRIYCGGWSLPGVNLAVRKEALLRVGGINPELAFYEDADISLRLKNIGKVMLDPKFRVKTSGRRFKDGLLPGLTVYALNAVIRVFLRKKKYFRLPDVRTESPFLGKFSFVPLFLSVLLLLFSFNFSNPLTVYAREKKSLKNKIIFVENKIKNDDRRVRCLLAEFEKNKFKSTIQRFNKHSRQGKL